MANFFKPNGGGDGYVEKRPNGLSFIHVPLNGSKDVALFGGYPSGQPLWVNLNDFDSAACSATCSEKSSQGDVRVFQIRGRAVGSSMLEARLGGRGGPVWDYAQIVVRKGPVVRTGPRFGSDGTILAHDQGLVRMAMDKAWDLNKDPNFVEAFRDTVSKLSGKKLSSDAYAEALNRMIIHLADTSQDPRVKRGIADEAIDVRSHAVKGPAPAMSFRGEPNIWIRSFAFPKGIRQITSCIIHEAAHVAGAPGDPVAEFALDVIHRAAGLPR
jgi:hypothetical protein